MSYTPQVNGVITVTDIKLNGIALSSATGSADGTRRVGDFDDYANFTPTAATTKGALLGIDAALASVGTVSQVNTGVGLTGGPITSTGTISLANTAVTPGSYTNASITVDQQGRLTAASSGTAGVSIIGLIDSQAPSANGLVISGSSLYAQSASALFPGMVNNTTQVFSGNKTIVGTGVGQIDVLTLDSDDSTSLIIKNTGFGLLGLLIGNEGGPTADYQIYNQDMGILKITSDGGVQFDSTISMNGFGISNVLDPVSAQDVATKAYVDAFSSGVDPKESVHLATTSVSDFTGAIYTTSPANGQFTSGPTTLDSVLVVTSRRYLVKDQADAKQNGIYAYDGGGQYTRAPDQDGSPLSEVSAGNFTFVEQGTVNANRGYVVIGNGTLILNTDNIVWTLFTNTSTTTFTDDVFRIKNISDLTKQIAFLASGIAPGNTRTIIMGDENITLTTTSASSFSNRTLSNLGTTSINQDLLPSATNTFNLGSATRVWSTVWTPVYKAYDAGNGVQTGEIRGSSGQVGLNGDSIALNISSVHNAGLGRGLSLHSDSSAAGDAVQTGHVLVESGHKTAGTGNSGDIKLLIGTSAGGTQGNIKFLKTGLPSTVGYIWTALDTVGSGYWAPGSGATFPLLAPNGSAAAPSYSFSSDSDTGMWLGGGPEIIFSVNAGNILSITSGGIKPIGGGGSKYSGQPTEQWSTVYSNFMLGSDGSAAAPTFAFIGDTDTGMWRGGSNTLIFTAGASNVFAVVAGAILATGSGISCGHSTQAWSNTYTLGLLSTGTSPLAISTPAGASTGNITVTSGNASSTTSGDIALTVGTAVTTQGEIKLLKSGVPAVVGQVWTATNVNGAGYWATATASPSVPTWIKYTVSHTALQVAATTNDIQLFSLPTKGIIHGVVISQSASFTGGAISAYTLSVGIAADLVKYAGAFDVFQAPGAGVGQTTNVMDFENKTSATSIRLAAISTGANLDQSTTGSVDVWVLWATLP